MVLELLTGRPKVVKLGPVSLEKVLEKDISHHVTWDQGGILGVGVDPETGHVWFGHNKSNNLKEIGSEFVGGASYSPEVGNFRKICFKDGRAYITDAEYGGSLRVFNIPDFSREKVVDLKFLGFSADHIVFYKDKILVGGMSCGHSYGRLTDYKVAIVDPKTWEVRKTTLRGITTIFQQDNKLFGLSEERNPHNIRRVGLQDYAPKYIFNYALKDGKLVENGHVRADIPGSFIGDTDLCVDKKGTIFAVRSVYMRENDDFKTVLCAVRLADGMMLGQSSADGFSDLALDNTGKLIVLDNPDLKKLNIARYAINYKDKT